MRGGEIVEVGASEVFYAEPEHPYHGSCWQHVIVAEAVDIDVGGGQPALRGSASPATGRET